MIPDTLAKCCHLHYDGGSSIILVLGTIALMFLIPWISNRLERRKQ